MPLKGLSRRQFLKYVGAGGAAAVASTYGLPALAQGSPPPGDTAGKLTIYNFGNEAQQGVNAEAIARFNAPIPTSLSKTCTHRFRMGGGSTSRSFRCASPAACR